MNNANNPSYSVVTFAYNEEKTIAATLRSIIDNADQRLCHISIIANGCSDNTYKVAKSTLEKYATCKFNVIDLALGDKCNAWNHYVYSMLPECDVHFFVDSDVTFTTQAFPKLFDKLIASNHNAVTGLPQSGRNSKHYTELATRYSCLFGNLYGLKHEFLSNLTQQGIRLPIALSWIDSQLTKLVNHNLNTLKDDYQNRVTFEPGVGYLFPSLKPWRRADFKLYINRLVRYKVGQLQEVYLDELPFVKWPPHIKEINQRIIEKGIPLKRFGKLILLKPLIMKRLNKFSQDTSLPNTRTNTTND